MAAQKGQKRKKTWISRSHEETRRQARPQKAKAKRQKETDRLIAMLEPNFFNTLFVFPILNLLVLFYKGFLLVKLPGAFGFAIVGLTVLIRGLFNPFFKKQIETAKKMAELKPHLDHLSKKHKDDQKTLQAEQLKLYQQAGINPASGCLFMIIQIPVFIALYQTLSLFLTNGQGAKAIAAINNVLYAPFLKIAALDPIYL